MARVSAKPYETPCVIEGCPSPTSMAFCHAGIEQLTGRVCEPHADQLVAKGFCVASDGGVVRNYGRVA